MNNIVNLQLVKLKDHSHDKHLVHTALAASTAAAHVIKDYSERYCNEIAATATERLYQYVTLLDAILIHVYHVELEPRDGEDE